MAYFQTFKIKIMRANKEKMSEEKEAQSDKLCDTRLIITQRWWKKISRLKPDDRAELHNFAIFSSLQSGFNKV